MKPTVIIGIPVASEALVRRLVAMHKELEALALAAPDGTVLETCEEAEKKAGPIRLAPRDNRGGVRKDRHVQGLPSDVAAGVDEAGRDGVRHRTRLGRRC
jgi:hypothetical protein